MRKIVFLIESKFNKRDYDRFGIEILRNRGFDIELWDLCSIFREEDYKNYTPSGYLYLDYIFHLTRKEEFCTKVNKLEKGAVVLALIGRSQDHSFVYEILHKYNICYGISISELTPSCGLLGKLAMEVNTRPNFLKILTSVMKKIGVQKKDDKYPPSFVLCEGGGKAEADGARFRFNGAKTILTHAFDYDLFLKEEQFPSHRVEKEYAVFLDQYLYFHPDIFNKGDRVRFPLSRTADWYHSMINKFFSKIEQDLGLKVIIASSPRANYNDYFDGRKVLQGKTIQLVRNSSLVIAHYSTSVNFAVIYKKPLIFITNSEFSLWMKCFIKGFAYELGSIPIDTNKIVDNVKIPVVNEERYDLCRENYIKMKGTPEKNTWEIFADYCEDLSD